MEVHHHPKVKNKKFKEYFFEFLMIFLAVTLGFFAENLREHLVESSREKEFMKSMTEDIVKDTAMLREASLRAVSVRNHIDSALYILHNRKLDKSSVHNLYRINLGLLSYFGVGFTDRTSIQLKYSGNMRLVQKHSVSESIIEYWNKESQLILISDMLDDYKMRAREKSYKIFDQKYYSESSGDGAPFVSNPSPKLMTQNINQLTEFANRLSHIKNLIMNVYIPQLTDQVTHAENLLKLINDEYNFN